MREIKFRVWDNMGKIMIGIEQWLAIELSGAIDVLTADGTYYRANKNGYILMQYTGLKDRNEKEIYEDDIVKDGYDEPLGRVIFEEGCFVIEILDGRGYTHYPETRIMHFEECEIIGNIYENPELLEK